MVVKLCVPLLCLLFFLADGCGPQSKDAQPPSAAVAANQPQAATQAAAPPSPAPKAAAPDACALISVSEIESVQGDKVTGTKGSRRSGGPFHVSQCFYTAAKYVNSVSLEVTERRPDDSNQNAVLEFWTRQFRESKDTRRSVKPRSVRGVGDEAYWAGGSKTGALYALKKDKYLRVSVGGGDAEEVKLQKSKKLAEYALKRL